MRRFRYEPAPPSPPLKPGQSAAPPRVWVRVPGTALRSAPAWMKRRWRPAFSMVEVMVALLIVGGLFVAALNTVSASRLGQVQIEDTFHGQMLAQALLSEVLQQPYAEGNGPLGLEVDETLLNNTRSGFDDVDDYHGWTGSPPQDKAGDAIAGFDGWTRRVEVAWVDPDAPATSVNSDQGAKRITVTVLRGQVDVATLVALRTQDWPTLEATQEVIAP